MCQEMKRSVLFMQSASTDIYTFIFNDIKSELMRVCVTVNMLYVRVDCEPVYTELDETRRDTLHSTTSELC